MSISAIEEPVIISRHIVKGVRVDRSTVDFYIFDAALARNASEHAVDILCAGRINIGVDLIGKTGNLHEASVFTGNCRRAPFQRVQNLLAGRLDNADFVPERKHFVHIFHRDIAGRNTDPDASAAKQGDVCPGHEPISICTQIAQVRFRPADHADFAPLGVHSHRVVNSHFLFGNSDFPFQELAYTASCLLYCRGHFIFDSEHLWCGIVKRPGINTSGHFALSGDPAPSDVLHLGPAGGAGNFFSVLVFHDHLIRVMAVAVQEGVDPVGMGDHIRVSPGAALFFISQVTQHDHIFRALFSRIVHSGLHGIVYALPRLILEERVDKLTVFILEKCGLGRRDRSGSRHADKTDLSPPDLPDDIRVKHIFALVLEIAGNIFELCLFSKRKEIVHTIVKLMITGYGYTVAHLVHEIN